MSQKSRNSRPFLINFEQNICNFKGLPLKIDEGQEVVTLKWVAVTALLAGDPTAQTLTAAQKCERFNLAERIHASSACDLTQDEVELIKALAGKQFVAMIVGPVFRMLDAEVRRLEPQEA